MPTAQELELVMTAKDRASQVLREVRGELQQVARVTSELGRTMGTAGGGVQAFNRDIGQVQGRAHAASAGLGSLAKGALAGAGAFAAFKGLDVAMQGVGAAVGFVGESVIGLNSRLETATTGFTTMLGSAEAAKAFLDELAAFAAETPFEFDSLITGSQRLLALGFSAEEVIPLLTSVGDAVAAVGGNAQTIDRVTLALAQMQSKGKVSAEEILQLAEAGIPAWELLAEHIGVSTGEVQKLASEGKIAAGTFIEAFQAFSEANFGGAMEAQSQTFAGAMSTIEDSLRMAVAQGGRPFFEMLRDGAVQLAQFTNSSEFQQWAEDAAVKAQEAADAIRDLVSEHRDDLANLAGDVRDGAVAFGELSVKIGEAATKLDELLSGENDDEWGDMLNFARTFGKIITGEAPTEAEWTRFLGGDQLNGFLNMIGAVAETTTRDVAGITAAIKELTGGSITSLQGIETQLGVSFANVDAVYQFFTGRTKEAHEQFLGWVKDVGSAEPLVGAYGDVVFEIAEAQGTAALAMDRSTQAGHRALQVAHDLGVSTRELASAYQPLSAQLATLAGAYQTAGAMAGIFNAQGSEFSAIAGDLERAYDTLNERKAAGLALSDEELRFLEQYPDNYARIEGAVGDAAIQAGLYRQAQVDLMQAQDELNAAIGRGESDLAPYRQAVDDAEQSLGDAAEASGGMRDANSLLTDVILTSLTPAIRDLRDILIELEGLDPEVTITADTTPAYADIQAFKDYLANNPASIDLYVNRIDAIGFTENEPTGGFQSSTRTWDRLFTGLPEAAAEASYQAGLVMRDVFGEQGRESGREIAREVVNGLGPVVGAFGDTGRDAGRAFGEAFEGEFAIVWDETWSQAAGRVEDTFTTDIASIFSGEAAAAAQAAADAASAFMEAWLDAGFSPDAPAFVEAQEAFDAAMAELGIIAAIAGTDAAKDYWEQWRESLPKEFIGPAMIELDEARWFEVGADNGAMYAEGYITGWHRIDPALIILDSVSSLPWADVAEAAGFGAGTSFADAFNKAKDAVLIPPGSGGAGSGDAGSEAGSGGTGGSGGKGSGVAAPGGSGGPVGLSAVSILPADFSDLVAGVKQVMQGTQGWAEALAAGAVISIDGDGLQYPQSGYEFWKSGQNIYLNPFAKGGIVTGPTLALLGDNPSGRELVLPLERARDMGFGGPGAAIQQPKQTLVVQLTLDGRVIDERVIDVMAREDARLL